MDLFTRMAQNTVTDLSVFRTKRTQKEMLKPKQEEAAKQEDPAKKKVKQEEPQKTVQTALEDTASAVPILEEKPMQDTDTQSDVPAEEEQQSEAEVSAESPKETEEHVPAEAEQEQGRIIQFKQPENPNEEAAIKLEMQLETAKSNLLPVFPIVRYLKNKCMNDDAFAAVVNDERKTLAKCFEYVTGEVKKALNGPGGWLDDNEVYAYAETYFLTDEAVFEKIAAEKAEAERKRQEEVAKKRKEQEEKRKKAEEKKKKKKRHIVK